MKKTTKFLISLSIFLMLVMPVLAFAQIDLDLVPCGTSRNTQPCEFRHFMDLINNVIRFILFYLVIPIAAIMFAYAGFKLVTSGGSAEARGVAKKVFTNAVIGFVVAVGAWLIVRTILSILGYDGAWIFDNF